MWKSPLSVLSCAAVCFTSAVSQAHIVDVGYAKYKGNQTYPNAIAYLGIPYAEPPVGDLRFRAPQSLNTTRVAGFSTFVTDATQYPDFCIQGTTGAGDAGGAGSEDCLKLNIYAPPGANSHSKLPVLYYIHGGGYVYGNPRNWPFDHWVHQSPNVVIVSVYYRLNSFGFLTSPEFTTNPKLGDLNAGFQDQTQGLKWIKQYISAFGGDPNRVIINGESAGGSSVELHLIANEAEKLFSGAIAQSVYRAPVPLPGQQKDLFAYYANQAGCGTGVVATQMACLRNASVSALSRAQDASNFNFTGPYHAFHPVVDGKIIRDYPTRLISQRNYAHVPLIVGATSNETLASGSNVTSALQSYWPAFAASDADQIAKLYPVDKFDSAQQQLLVLTGDASVRCARTILADAYADTTKSWAYRYNQPNPTGGDNTLVNHAAENWMMFLGTNTGFNGTAIFTPFTPVETAFSEELIAYWLSFVRAGDPNTYKLARSPYWTGYSPFYPARVVLTQDPNNSTTVSGVTVEDVSNIESQRCRLVGSKAQDEQA